MQPRSPSVDVSERAARQGRAPVQPTKVEVELTESQAAAFRVGPIGRADFELVRQAVGNIDFNQNMLVQVFTPYQGRIVATFGRPGDRVRRGQVLFTVDSPDLLQAENTLISAAGVAILQARTLKRVTENLRSGGGAQKDVDQATSDQQAAEGALHTARDAVRIFGKTDEEIDRIIANRQADPILIVRSPIDGVITQSVGAPGLLVQPGNAPAPSTVADTSLMWMIANPVEADSADLRVGQPVKVRVAALPGREFDGQIVVVGASVDMQTRRIGVRSEISNPDGLLRAGMFATFTIKVGDTRDAVAVPDAAVVREGDGTMTLWVTTDRRHFEKRTVKIGLRQKGFTEILEGATPGELIATEGAVFLSNKLLISPAG
ncbi:efflux RND transporter periplasmic adaptor subunit [Enhydrobacter aerosaccus]|uniref:efflux RND transporter periplasmic adaptor subunit n=1 Tax=Enhydrobacter aerosaccus TaxID=225324 RepID=UPI001C468DB4|nr:efflux RND transporter periplasmic adaptor subunit [Enhydrobacter aerosaccus]